MPCLIVSFLLLTQILIKIRKHMQIYYHYRWCNWAIWKAKHENITYKTKLCMDSLEICAGSKISWELHYAFTIRIFVWIKTWKLVLMEKEIYKNISWLVVLNCQNSYFFTEPMIISTADHRAKINIRGCPWDLLSFSIMRNVGGSWYEAKIPDKKISNGRGITMLTTSWSCLKKCRMEFRIMAT